jgi:DNA-binding transcriptional ArsR family regulator
LCVCDLAAVLRGLRLVRPRREGRIVFYSLDDQHIISIFKQTLQHVQEERVAPAKQRRASVVSR